MTAGEVAFTEGSMDLRRYGLHVAAFLSVILAVCHAAGASERLISASSLVFEQNQGQAPAGVRFLARRGSMLLALEDDAFTLATANGEWIRFSFDCAGRTPAVHGEGRLPGTRNYFVGDDPSRWVTDVPAWERVRIDDLYPGIDVVFRSSGEKLEYDFVVAPGASPKVIAMTVGGTMRLQEERGALVASTSDGVAFRQLAPASFQAAPRSRPVTSACRLHGNEIRFAVGQYNAEAELIIDPVIETSTYIGGNSGDEAHAVAVDAGGNIYIAGETYSTDYPFLGGVQPANQTPSQRDGFITKLDPSGRRVIFSTYFGGNAYDLVQAIAVDSTGAVYVAGNGYSTNLPVTANAFQKKANIWVGDDGFLVKLSPAGNAIVYCTYLGANSDKPSFETLRGIAVDAQGNAFVVGDTTDPTWPVTAGAFRTVGCDSNLDAFVTKVSPDGSSLVYSTYLCGSGWDYGRAIRVDAAGNAFATGSTSSSDFPQVGLPPAVLREGDAWVAKLNPSGSALLRSTLIGGSHGDGGASLALGPDGSVYVAGTTRSADFPVLDGYQQSYRGASEYCQNGPPPAYCGDSFVARLSPDLVLLSATFLGGARSDDSITAIGASSAGVVVVGTTESADFPLVSPTQSTYGGKRDTFVSVFDRTLHNLTFSTFVGGNDWDVGEAVASDSAGAIYVTGYTGSTNFPTSNAYRAASAGSFDAFVVKFSAPAPTPPRKRAVGH